MLCEGNFTFCTKVHRVTYLIGDLEIMQIIFLIRFMGLTLLFTKTFQLYFESQIVTNEPGVCINERAEAGQGGKLEQKRRAEKERRKDRGKEARERNGVGREDVLSRNICRSAGIPEHNITLVM